MCRKMAGSDGKSIPNDELKIMTGTRELTKVGEGRWN
jgi:hypothetical protein